MIWPLDRAHPRSEAWRSLFEILELLANTAHNQQPSAKKCDLPEQRPPGGHLVVASAAAIITGVVAIMLFAILDLAVIKLDAAIFANDFVPRLSVWLAAFFIGGRQLGLGQ